jgi:tetratricopeptide (TPR) repeat protein
MEAEQSYRHALTLNPNLLPARHNLALLLSHEKGGDREAIELWRQNLQQSPDYIPSHISLAGFLAERGDNSGAIQEYRTIVTLKPDYIAARLALGKLLSRTGDPEGALRELRAAIESNSQNPELFEEIGDVEAAGGHAAEARAAYRQALTLAPDAATRKRIANKLKGR